MPGIIRILTGAAGLITGEALHCLPVMIAAAVAMAWGAIANCRKTRRRRPRLII